MDCQIVEDSLRKTFYLNLLETTILKTKALDRNHPLNQFCTSCQIQSSQVMWNQSKQMLNERGQIW